MKAPIKIAIVVLVLALAFFVLQRFTVNSHNAQIERNQPNYYNGVLTITFGENAENLNSSPLITEIGCSDDREICEDIYKARDALGPQKDVACTEQYGGDQQATVVGNLDELQVTWSFSRANGCKIAQWDRLDNILKTHGIDALSPGMHPSN